MRILLRALWDGANGNGLRGLVKMLFQRFSQMDSCFMDIFDAGVAADADSEFIEQIALSGDLRYLTEIEFQLGRRAEAHFTFMDGTKRKEFIIDPLNLSLPMNIRTRKVGLADLQHFGELETPLTSSMDGGIRMAVD